MAIPTLARDFKEFLKLCGSKISTDLENLPE